MTVAVIICKTYTDAECRKFFSHHICLKGMLLVLVYIYCRSCIFSGFVKSDLIVKSAALRKINLMPHCMSSLATFFCRISLVLFHFVIYSSMQEVVLSQYRLPLSQLLNIKLGRIFHNNPTFFFPAIISDSFDSLI